MAVAKMLYGNSHSSMVLEVFCVSRSIHTQLNASDDRGINVVREQIKVFAGTKKLFHTGVKLVILDEADNMNNAAQFALRRSISPPNFFLFPLVIEKYSQNTRFCLICNYVSEIIPAVQSRCTRFRFQPLNPQLIRSRLLYILRQEKYPIPAGILN